MYTRMAHRLASLDYRVGSDISERHEEGCTPIRCRLRPDPAFVTRDDALDRGKPDSGALEFGFGMKALEGGEKLLGMRHVESRAVVANEESLVGSPPRADFDARVGSLRCELPRVAKKVFEYHLDELRIGVRDKIRSDFNVDLALGFSALEIGKDLSR